MGIYTNAIYHNHAKRLTCSMKNPPTITNHTSKQVQIVDIEIRVSSFNRHQAWYHTHTKALSRAIKQEQETSSRPKPPIS